MAFDLSTAAPVATGGFDLSTAKPIPSGGGIPGPRRAWSDVPGEALANVGTSAQKFFGGVVEAVTSPLQTAKGVLDIGAGALQNVLPKNVVDFVNQFDAHPEAAQQAVKVANAVGGMYKERYGSIEGLKNTLATDPVGAAADMSTLFSGGAAATTRIAPGVSKILSTAATLTNPMTPVIAGVTKAGAPVASAIGKTVEALKGELPAQKAARIAREAAGPALADIRAAAINAPANLTAAQAISGVTERAPAMQALAADVQSTLAGTQKFFPKQEAAIRGREAAIQAVTPDKAAAIAARTQATTPLYEQANKAAAQISPELQSVFERFPSGTLEKAAEIARMDKRPFIIGETKLAQEVPTGLLTAGGQPFTKTAPATTAAISGESLHYIKRALSDIANASPATGIGRDTQAAARNVLTDYLKVIESPEVLPVYGAARQTFAKMSEPVNQAQVLNEMLSVLQKPGGGERVQPFLNALGRGEEALLKRSTGQPRYTELGQVLTEPQLNVVQKVAGEMTRDVQMAAQARAGQNALTEILSRNSQSAKKFIPNFIDAKAAIARETTSLLEGKVNEKTIGLLTDAFESGKSLSTLLNKIPFKERNEVLRAIGDAQGRLSPAKLTALGLSANALAPEVQDKNALAPYRVDLSGMANK
jgi:hypothetical protein